VIFVRDKAWPAGLAALPAVAISVLLYGFFRRTLLDHVPGVINDAIDYWLEARAFVHAGFGSGYFTIDERPAPASFSHFGSHGPLFPVLHGMLGRVVGWHAWSIPVVHTALMCAALLFFARRVPLDRNGRVLTVLSVVTFWPLLLFLPTSLQEGLHLAVAALLAAALRPLLDGRATSRGWRASLVVILVAASLMRPSWGLLLPAIFVILFGAASRRRQVLAAMAGLGVAAAVVVAFAYTAAPFGREEFFFVKVARLQEGASALVTRAATNASRFVQAGSALEVRSRFLVLALALASAVLAGRARSRRELAFNAYNLGSILIAALLAYVFGPWADYRVFAAPLLLSALLLASSTAPAPRRLAVAVLLAQLASVGPFIEAFKGLGDSYGYDAARIEAFGAAVRPGITFGRGQDGWCNTLVSVNPPYFYPEMVALPPGIGVTMLFGSGDAPWPALRSQYVLLDPEDPRRWSLGTPKLTLLGPERVHLTVGDWLSLDLKPLAPTPVGQLYENLAARCPRP
jgi:hypothetical protein